MPALRFASRAAHLYDPVPVVLSILYLLLRRSLALARRPDERHLAVGQYYRLKGRACEHATMAVGHSILVAAYHILAGAVPYADLGPITFLTATIRSARPTSSSDSSGPSATKTGSNP